MRRRSAASASRAWVWAFSFTSIFSRAAPHSCGETIGGVFIVCPPVVSGNHLAARGQTCGSDKCGGIAVTVPFGSAVPAGALQPRWRSEVALAWQSEARDEKFLGRRLGTAVRTTASPRCAGYQDTFGRAFYV